jgi:hypothetical protein
LAHEYGIDQNNLYRWNSSYGWMEVSAAKRLRELEAEYTRLKRLLADAELLLLKKASRRTKVVGAFPDGDSALILVAAKLGHVSTSAWGTRKYMNMILLKEMDQEVMHSVA